MTTKEQEGKGYISDNGYLWPSALTIGSGFGVVHVWGWWWMYMRERESVFLCSDMWEKHKDKARREEEKGKKAGLPEQVSVYCSCVLYPALGTALNEP